MLLTDQEIHLTKYLIVANGDFVSASTITSLATDRIILALDGAANRLQQIQVTADFILGDFDSIELSDMFNCPLLHAPDQNYTDLEKAVQYCDAQQASDIAIVCATGGRLDHHQATIHLLLSQYRKNRPLRLYTTSQVLFYVCDDTIVIQASAGEKCGIFPEHASSFTTRGLVYDVVNATQPSIGNSFREALAEITVQGSALLIMPR